MNSTALILNHLNEHHHHHQQPQHHHHHQLHPQDQQATVQLLDATYALFRDQTRFWIQRVAVPLIMVIGLFGNLITVIIMTSRRMRSTTNLYLAALAFVDMLYLVLTFLLGLSHYPNMAASRYSFYWHSRPFLMMLTDACSNTSVWLTVTFTIERYIAVRYPMKGKVWCTEARAKKLIGFVFIFGLLFASPVPFEWKVIEKTTQRPPPASPVKTFNQTDPPHLPIMETDNDSTILMVNNAGDTTRGTRLMKSGLDEEDQAPLVVLALDYSDFGRNETYKTIYYWSTAVIFYFIPLISLTLFNSFLIKSVHHSQRERNKMTNKQSLMRHSDHSPSLPISLTKQQILVGKIGTTKTGDKHSSKINDEQRRQQRIIEFKKVLVAHQTDSDDGARSRRANPPTKQSTRGLRHNSLIVIPFIGNTKSERRQDLKGTEQVIKSSLEADKSRLKTSQSVPENCDRNGQIDLTYKIIEEEISTTGAAKIIDQREMLNLMKDVDETRSCSSASLKTCQSKASTTTNHQHHLPTQKVPPIYQPTNACEISVKRNNNNNSLTATKRMVNSQSATSLVPKQHHHHPPVTSSSQGATQSVASSSHPSSSSQERRITIMLISVVILFLVCQIPSAAMLLYTSVHETIPNTNEHALLLAFGNIFNFLMAINAAGNFILYSFLSRKYRKTFVILFCRCFKSKTTETAAGKRVGGSGGVGTCGGGGGGGGVGVRRSGGGGSGTNTNTESSCCEPSSTTTIQTKAPKLSQPQVSYSSMALNPNAHDSCVDIKSNHNKSNIGSVGRVVSVRFKPSVTKGTDNGTRAHVDHHQQSIIYEQPTPSRRTNGDLLGNEIEIG